jgi:hypothetical protein
MTSWAVSFQTVANLPASGWAAESALLMQQPAEPALSEAGGVPALPNPAPFEGVFGKAGVHQGALQAHFLLQKRLHRLGLKPRTLKFA